jgi:hypothetical protein
VNWEAISAIGQLVGALAVVISLIYLATEVRSNARATRQAAMRSTLDSLNRFAQQIIGHADLAELRIAVSRTSTLSKAPIALALVRLCISCFGTQRIYIINTYRGIWIHVCGVGLKWSCGKLMHSLEFRPGGVHARIGSMRSLRSSLISNSKQRPGMMTSS